MRVKRWVVRTFNKQAVAVLVMLIIGGLGTYLLAYSHAATPTTSTEAENGSVSSAANVINDPTASNNNAVKFGEAGALRTLNCAPSPADTMDNTISHLCGFPDSTNTGVEAGVTLASSGCVDVTQDNTVVQNIKINNCDIEIQASNVTIKNVEVVGEPGPSTWGIRIQAGYGPVTIEHVSVHGTDSADNAVQYGIYNQSDSDVSVTYSDIYNCPDCIQGEHMTVTHSYIHDVNGPAGSHRDGVQCFSNYGCDMDVENNTILMPSGGAAVAVRTDFGNPTGATISNNLLAGGGYTVYGGDDGRYDLPAVNVHIENNHFSRMYWPDCGQYGSLAYFDPTASGNIFSGNIWDDTGQPVSD